MSAEVVVRRVDLALTRGELTDADLFDLVGHVRVVASSTGTLHRVDVDGRALCGSLRRASVPVWATPAAVSCGTCRSMAAA